ncbi:glycoside hydrolase [Longibacter salinarum]|uniref:Glycoside hydrolase n=1 Tax=Longibacter salinarum TaxID=1850348 RepID=A0A2A8CV37_9BACT|nr:glycosyltransferase family 4 protein [Longibacter salinarum]PEN12318.1 glycoside hydrolase [Longibacter salinarum]
MRLLFVTQDFPPAVGGIQTYSWELVRRWSDVGAVHVIAPSHKDASDVDTSLSARVTRVPTAPETLPLRGIPSIIRVARSFQPDIAFHGQWHTLGASLLAQRLTGFPRRIVCAAHGRELLFNPLHSIPLVRSTYTLLRRSLLRIPDLFVPVSRYTADLLHSEGVDPARTHVMPNGVDPTRFQPLTHSNVRAQLDMADRPTLLTVGRLVPRKGLDTTICALRSVLKSVPDAQYLIVGSGPDQERLQHLVSHHDLTDSVHFIGRVAWDSLPQYYNAADVFVMPSREDPPDVEGFGLVFLEANACGTPVVGAAAGGVPDAIIDGVTGYLVPPADPDALADVLVDLLKHPARAREIGQVGRLHTEGEASWDHVANAMLHEIRATL